MAGLTCYRQDGSMCDNGQLGQNDKQDILTKSDLSYCLIINHGVPQRKADGQPMEIQLILYNTKKETRSAKLKPKLNYHNGLSGLLQI